MAFVAPTNLMRVNISARIRKDAQQCIECGKSPVPFEADMPDYRGKRFGMGCPDRHSLVQAEAITIEPGGDLAEYYRSMIGSIGPMIDAWNDQQQEKRTASMFPGKAK